MLILKDLLTAIEDYGTNDYYNIDKPNVCIHCPRDTSKWQVIRIIPQSFYAMNYFKIYIKKIK